MEAGKEIMIRQKEMMEHKRGVWSGGVKHTACGPRPAGRDEFVK